jgi:hypothetical protein
LLARNHRTYIPRGAKKTPGSFLPGVLDSKRGRLKKNKFVFSGQGRGGRYLACVAHQKAARICRVGEVEMDTPIKVKPAADLRDYLAEERTFLAWIRTGIALMGSGLWWRVLEYSGTSPTWRNRPQVNPTICHSGLEPRSSLSAQP